MCILLSLLLFYFLFTPLGTANVYTFISHKLSQKTDLQIEVKSIDITYYPHINIVMNIEKKAKLTLWGYLDDNLIDMDYSLTSNCITTEYCKIDDNIDIKGDIKGPFTKLYIEGKGLGLDGNISYSATKYTNKVKNLHLKLYDINSTKLIHLLGQTALIKGKANADVRFSFMDEYHKKGRIIYNVEDKHFKGIPLKLHTTVDIEDQKHTFDINITSKNVMLNISKGTYNQKTKKAHALYLLDIKELSKLDTLLGYRYKGALYMHGELFYDREIKITGLSKSFGGLTYFLFKKETLYLTLTNVYLHKILSLFPFPPMLTAQANGIMDYNFIDNKLTVNTKLTHAKFVHTKLVDIIYKKSGVHMMNEVFNNSKLNLTYQNNIILGDLILANSYSHVYLTNTKINTQVNNINAYFDFKMQKQEFSGKVFGSLDNPKVNLNMQKLIRYQMDKQVDKMIGKHNRKMMEKMPMGGVAKDMATDMGASFMKVFF
jgi:hypothetical protein